MGALWLFRSQARSQPVRLVLQQKPRSILSKYDEELEGERPHSFRLEQGGAADGLRERELEEIRAKLRLQAQSLSTAGPRLASEYLTPEEMVSRARFNWGGDPSLSSGVVCCLGRLWRKSGEGGALALVGQRCMAALGRCCRETVSVDRTGTAETDGSEFVFDLCNVASLCLG